MTLVPEVVAQPAVAADETCWDAEGNPGADDTFWPEWKREAGVQHQKTQKSESCGYITYTTHTCLCKTFKYIYYHLLIYFTLLI